MLIHTLWLLYLIYFDCLFDEGVLDFGAFLLACLLACLLAYCIVLLLFFGVGKSGGVGRCGSLCGRKEGRKEGRIGLEFWRRGDVCWRDGWRDKKVDRTRQKGR